MDLATEVKELARDLLAELFSLADTGDLIWKAQNSSGEKIGAIAGNINKEGYRQIFINDDYYLAQDLVWIIETGKFPEEGDYPDTLAQNILRELFTINDGDFSSMVRKGESRNYDN